MSEVGPGRFHVHFSVPSDLRYTDLFHSVLTQLAQEVGIPEERLDWVTLALREAVNNAVLHGNKKDASKTIQVEFDADENEFVMKVWDQGPGFDDAVLGDPRNPENLFRPNGRGIFLIRQLLDKARFLRHRGGWFGLEMTVALNKKEESTQRQEAAHE
jgi:serine/threonine-protein kinase RsbW